MNNQLMEINDAFAKTYEENRGQFDMSDVLNGFYSTLNLKNGKLLDVGCGAGEPVARYFTDHNWSVIGVDFSEQMIGLASRYVPEMQTIHADTCEVDFESSQLDAIRASYRSLSELRLHKRSQTAHGGENISINLIIINRNAISLFKAGQNANNRHGIHFWYRA